MFKGLTHSAGSETSPDSTNQMWHLEGVGTTSTLTSSHVRQLMIIGFAFNAINYFDGYGCPNNACSLCRPLLTDKGYLYELRHIFFEKYVNCLGVEQAFLS